MYSYIDDIITKLETKKELLKFKERFLISTVANNNREPKYYDGDYSNKISDFLYGKDQLEIEEEVKFLRDQLTLLNQLILEIKEFKLEIIQMNSNILKKNYGKALKEFAEKNGLEFSSYRQRENDNKKKSMAFDAFKIRFEHCLLGLPQEIAALINEEQDIKKFSDEMKKGKDELDTKKEVADCFIETKCTDVQKGQKYYMELLSIYNSRIEEEFNEDKVYSQEQIKGFRENLVREYLMNSVDNFSDHMDKVIGEIREKEIVRKNSEARKLIKQ